MDTSEETSHEHSSLQRRNPLADELALREFLAKCPVKLPDDYVRLLRSTNGCEGELAIEPGWVQLWSTEDIFNLNQSYAVEEFHPGYFGFGSSGGGVMFAFNVHSAQSSAVFGIPFDSIDPDDIVVVANDFSTFARAMGYPWTADA